MNKLFTSLMLAGAVALGGHAQAQTIPQPLSSGNIKTNLAAVRFLVNTPSSLAGLKIVTQAPWGGQNPLYNAPVVRGLTLGGPPLTNASAIAGKVCLLFRGGGISFSQKADYAKNAGAIGVIIVNNIPGPALGMAQTGTNGPGIPVFMVTNTDGIAMNNALINGTSVTISTSPWSIAAHDLGLLTNFQSTPHAMSIPYSQLSAGANRLQYKNFVGGAVANYGTSSETGITVTDTVRWIPTTGASSIVHTGSYSVPNMGAPSSGSALDSVRFGFGGSSSPWSLTAPTTTGSYTYKYDLTYGNTDAVPQDNTLTYTQYVTDSIFCKGNYDYTKMQPTVSSSIQPSGITNAFSMGPLFYMAKGKYAAQKVQYSVTKNGAPTLDQEEAFALIFKWVDGSTGQLDSFVEGDELTLVGINRKLFTTSDTIGKVFTVNIADPNVPTKTVTLDSNAWYWVSVQASSTCFIGMDYTSGYFTRSYIEKLLLHNDDLPELLFTDDYTALPSTATALFPYPFGGNAYKIDSTFFDRFYYIPAVALHISKNQIGTTTPPNSGVASNVNNGFGSVRTYPNPVLDNLSVELKPSELQKDVAVRLLDISGKIIKRIDLKDVHQQMVNIPCNDVPAGIYYLAVFGDSGHTVNKVTVTH